ncbi:MAG TPA: 50S ribosomal protein L13 [Myxococcota bacterium]|nr:50S ribosomal protein L13 [Myxococcota bacterium]
MANPKNPTRSISEAEVVRQWFIADANDKVLGRFASRVASVLRGKHKPTFTPHVDGGDFVVVVNAGQVRLTGRKLQRKEYIRHSGYPGGLRTDTAADVLARHPDRVVRAAVKGMLPKGPLGRRMLRKLKVYPGAEHPHAAQKPVVLEIRT